MKKPNLDIQALAKKIFHHKRGIQRPKLMHPQRDWLIGISGGLLLFIGIVAWSAFVYLDQREGIQFTNDDAVAELPTYQADAVAEALDIFSTKQDNFSTYSASRQPIIIEEPTGPPPGIELPSEIPSIQTPVEVSTSTLNIDESEPTSNQDTQIIEEEINIEDDVIGQPTLSL